MAQGNFWKQVKQKGRGHGIRNHKHASGNRLSQEYYASFHSGWHPDRLATKKSRREARYKKNQRNKRKQ